MWELRLEFGGLAKGGTSQCWYLVALWTGSEEELCDLITL